MANPTKPRAIDVVNAVAMHEYSLDTNQGDDGDLKIVIHEKAFGDGEFAERFVLDNEEA